MREKWEDQRLRKALPKEPVEIRYKRWRSKSRGYVVEVTSTHNYSGQHGMHTVVLVVEKGSDDTEKWPAMKFLAEFEPLGRPIQRKSVWQRLRKTKIPVKK